MATAEDVKRRHEAELLRSPGVVGVGIGRREGRECIRVYVLKDDPKVRAALPRSLEEVPVEVVVTGRFEAR